MVFTNLSEEDKDAFFALLDEYFTSRPELAEALGLHDRANINAGPQASPQSLGVSAAHRALASNPQATSAAISAGLRSVPKSSPYAAAASNPEISNAVGRVAAASLAFNAPKASPGPSPRPGNSDLRPPPPPRRSTSSSSQENPEPPPRAPPRPSAGPPSGLVTQRKLGDIDTTSGKNMLWGMRKQDAPPPAVNIPPALASSKTKSFAPPPPRRVPSVKPRTPTPEPEPEPEPEGEWAKALYDYNGTDPNDLRLRADQRVLVTERTSDDWWTGEVDGRKGLFPASYVEVV